MFDLLIRFGLPIHGTERVVRHGYACMCADTIAQIRRCGHTIAVSRYAGLGARERVNQTTVKSRQMVIRGHRGDDIQNVNRTNQSDLVGRKTDPRTFEDCTRGMCAAATPKFFSHGMDV